jgi:PTS system N-acetylglucosamine-specific IIC component
MLKNGKVMGFAQKLGKALMTPIAVLPAAALLLRLGADDLLGIPWMAAAGEAIFANLGMIFAVSIAIAFAKNSNGVAGIAAAVSYFVIDNVSRSFSEDINLGVMGGIVAGLMAGYFYNRFHEIRVPAILGFFGGKRFVPIITALASVAVGALIGFTWPPIQEGIQGLGTYVISAGAFGSFVNGFINRLLLPFGLHHVLNTFVLFQLGEFETPTGEIVTGDLTRFFAGDPDGGMFVTGGYAVYMFGFPAVALAMVVAAKRKNRKAVGGILFSAALTAIITGVTEPIEFSFLFLSPVLLIVNAVLFGLVNAICVALDVRMGIGFSNGLIDYILTFNISTNPLLIIPIGIVTFVVYFLIFTFLIRVLNIPTPGRFDDEELEIADGNTPTLPPTPIDEGTSPQRVTLKSRADLSAANLLEKAKQILAGIGGKENIRDIEGCVTRIRISVHSDELVSKNALKAAGAIDVIGVGPGNYQIVIGTMADPIVNTIQDKL